MLVGAAILLASPAYATLVGIHIDMPCTNADSPLEPYNPCDTVGTSQLTDLSAIDVWGQRCGQTDSTLVGSIPARGAECDSLDADIDLEDGHTYWIWTRARDLSGHVSTCRGPQLTLAVPKADFVPGLWGAYFGAMDFTNFAYTRADANIDFAWGEIGPGAPMPGMEYSVRWTGKLRAPVTGKYYFRVHVKDGERLNIAGVQVTDNWIYQYAHDDIGSVDLTGGFSYPLTLEYLSHWGGSEVHLFWTRPGAAEELVPSAALEQP